MRCNVTMNRIMEYLKSTPEDSWCLDVVRTSDDKNCLFGHVFNIGRDIKESNELWDWFEYWVATTYMIYPVNDGKDPSYQQPTPKQRCLTYIQDILDGKKKSTYEMMNEDGIRLQSESECV